LIQSRVNRSARDASRCIFAATGNSPATTARQRLRDTSVLFRVLKKTRNANLANESAEHAIGDGPAECVRTESRRANTLQRVVLLSKYTKCQGALFLLVLVVSENLMREKILKTDVVDAFKRGSTAMAVHRASDVYD
jgi:hypothetical protein